MNLNQSLQQFGLNEKQAKVYLSCLKLGSATVQAIARNAEIKRPTVYVTLESLKQKGLVAIVPKKTTTEYRALEPKRIHQNLQTQEKLMKDLLPTLESIQSSTTGRPKITIYEGLEEMKKMYRQQYQAKEILYFGVDMEQFSKVLPDLLIEAEGIFKKIQNTTREIMNPTPYDIEFAKKNNRANRQFRIAPQGIKFNEDNAIWEDKIAIISIHEPYYAVVIENQSLADTYRALFEMAWQTALPPDKATPAK